MNVKNKTKHSLKVIGVMFMIISVVTVAPLNYLNMGDNSPVREAEGLVVTTTGGALVAGAAVVSGATYVATKYFSDSNEQVVEIINTTKDNATNETLREATHQTAITSAGNTESYLDSTDNAINTVEGSIRQRVGLRFIKVFDDENKTNITSETEAITEGSDAAGKYLNTTMRNNLETANFQTLSTKQLKNNLELAGYGSDIGQTNIISGDGKKINNMLGDYTGNGNSNKDLIIKMNDDWVVNSSTPVSSKNGVKVLFYSDNYKNVTINGGGYNIDINVSARMYEDIKGITFKNVDVNGADKEFGRNTDIANFINTNVTAQYPSDGANNIFVSNDSNVPYSSTNSSKLNIDVLDDITFDATKIANSNSNYANASEVPKVEFVNEGSNVTLPAKKFSLNQSYYGSSTAKMGVPYVKNSSGAYEQLADDETVIVKTTTSAITGYTEPFNYPRATQLTKDLNNVGKTAYSKAQTFAKDLWNAYLKDVVNNDNETIFNKTTGAVDPALGTLQYSAPKPGNTDAVINSYVGAFEGTTKPLSDTFKIKDIDENVTYTGALFSSNMTALMEQTNSSTKVEGGDTFNASINGTQTFVVSDNGGSHELEGDVKIKSVINQDSADVRTYDQDSTNLSDQAERLQDQKKVIEKTIINKGGGIGSIFDGNNGAILLVVGLLVLVAVSGGKD